MILDAVTRLIPGALGNEDSAVNESFSERLSRHREPALNARSSRCKVHRRRRHVNATSAKNRAFWIIRITRVRRRFEGGMSRKSCSAGITKRFANGGGKRALEKTLRNRPDLISKNAARRLVLRHVTREARGACSQIVAIRPQFAVAKSAGNSVESVIVRCMLAPPERVCREIMS